jgi:hypothetical protein
MIKGCSIPSERDVTAFAFRAKAALVEIFMPMAGKTILGSGSELIKVSSPYMAALTVRREMFPF